MSRRSPLATALGLGSAKDGTQHWWSQRVSAVAVLILGLWFAISAAILASGDISYFEVAGWLRAPLNTAALVGLVAALAWHSQLGVQVVIEDYLRGPAKIIALVMQRLGHLAVAAVAILAILQVAFGVTA